MATASQTRVTLDDLNGIEGKAELINGRIVRFMSTGVRPSEVASNIYVSLRSHVKRTGVGKAFNDNLGYGVPVLPSGRESFAPDTSFYDGPLPTNLMSFILGPPTLAVEVRSENDYGNAAEAEIALKRTEYFIAGAQIVWDVDPLAETVTCYRATAPDAPVLFKQGEIADAEPAVPGWRIAVSEVFA